MTEKENLIAFLAILVALVTLSGLGAFTDKPTDLAIMTGLIGVLGTFRPKNPVSNVENATNVTQGSST